MTREEIIAAYVKMVDLAVRPPTAAIITELFDIVMQLNTEPAEHLQSVADEVVALIQDRVKRDPTLADRLKENAATVRQIFGTAADGDAKAGKVPPLQTTLCDPDIAKLFPTGRVPQPYDCGGLGCGFQPCICDKSP